MSDIPAPALTDEQIAMQAVRATSGCRPVEPDVCDACAQRYESARVAVRLARNAERERAAAWIERMHDEAVSDPLAKAGYIDGVFDAYLALRERRYE